MSILTVNCEPYRYVRHVMVDILRWGAKRVKGLKLIKTYIVGKLHPQSYLSPELITLLTVHAIFLLAVGLSNTFINIFLWRVQKSLSIVVLFNAIHFSSVAATAIIGGWLAKRTSLTFNLRLGIVCYGILYVILLIVQDKAAHYIWILGILLGMSGGFYYISYNVLGYDFSSDDNRDYVMGIQGLVFSLATMVAPFVAGAIIESLKGLKGYILIFSVSLTLFVIAVVLSTRIPMKTVNKQYYIKSILLMPFKKINWRYAMAGEAIRGFREGVMMFLSNILLYALVSSELLIGYYTLICSTIQLFSFYFISRKMRPCNRKQYLFIGTIVVMAVSSIFIFRLSAVTIFAYGIITSFFITFINNPSAALIYWVIHKTPNSKKRRIEGIVAREVYLNIGRVTGVLLLLAVPEDIKVIAYVILGLGVSQIIMWYLFNKVKTE